MFVGELAEPAGEVRTADQAQFDGLDPAVREDETALGLNLLWTLRPKTPDARGVLRRQTGDHGSRMDAGGSGRLGIGLDAGAARRVVATDAQEDGG